MQATSTWGVVYIYREKNNEVWLFNKDSLSILGMAYHNPI